MPSILLSWHQSCCSSSCGESYPKVCCCCSVTKSCPTLCDHMDCSTLGLCPSLSPGVCSNSYPLSQWHYPITSSSVTHIPASGPQPFPASRSCPTSRLFALGGQSIRASASASILPMNIQGSFPSGLIGLTFLLSKRLSKVFSSTTIWKHQFFSTQPLYGPTLTSIHDYWKNHSFNYMNHFLQSDVSAFICCLDLS